MSNISVTDTGIRIVFGQMPVLDPTSAGTYLVPTITVDAFGRVASAVQNNDVALATTQQQILQTVDILVTTLNDQIVFGGMWDNTP